MTMILGQSTHLTFIVFLKQVTDIVQQSGHHQGIASTGADCQMGSLQGVVNLSDVFFVKQLTTLLIQRKDRGHKRLRVRGGK